MCSITYIYIYNYSILRPTKTAQALHISSYVVVCRYYYLLFSLELIEACLCSFTIKMLKYSTGNKVKNYLLFSLDGNGGCPKTPRYTVCRRTSLLFSLELLCSLTMEIL